ncbi:MAG: 4'-phosphopantetheinyl transferase superfamily protein [Holophagales bacterium]|nr:4'-phosphopantetheinyl transferase superfamily protein [Holophagales bacterium]MYD20988.1 4'-phosphopantetheinyl transferase superfamily protein [Holophagales bacterium]MYI33252.1 4'-phosphopantetheinyl transferase superfamily protein [Holophagales bacterium]
MSRADAGAAALLPGVSTARGVPPSLADSLPRDIAAAAHEIGPLEELIEEARRLGFSLPGTLESAIDKRRREYLAGRISGGYALRQLLGPDASEGEIAGDDDDVPRWPEGVVGSISHGAGFGFAAVAAADRYRGLGVDVERVVSTEQAGRLGARVLNEREMSLRQGSAGVVSEAEMFTLVFSAKESAYKALFPRYRQVLGFSDVELERREAGDGDAGCGELRLRTRVAREGGAVRRLVGWYALTGDQADESTGGASRVWAVVTIPSRDDRGRAFPEFSARRGP